MQKFIAIGNLTKDPELETTTSGINYTNFSIAVRRNYKNADGEYETDFFNCVAWRATAEKLCEYCKKGNKIAIVGALENSSYENKEGVKINTTKIKVESVEFLNSKNSESNTTASSNEKLVPVDAGDELPF